ncbi:MAG: hypothetical protein HY912_10225, partial [Desulfomonile tiedjei]|nr:hypothetical protein [Desulfomonile tiedjei]
MRLNRVWLLAAALSVSVFMLAPAASAWEFTMDGTYTWQYEYRTDLGSTGFFGPFNVDAGFTGAANSLNSWTGGQNNADTMNSGADAAWNVMYMTTNMDLRVNPAIRVRGQYYIGSWALPTPSVTTGPAAAVAGNPVASFYFNYTAPGIQRSFSPGYWNQLWLTAQLPWGTLTLGKRPSVFGTGLSWNGAENRASESFSLTTSYGPLRIGIGFYPAREGDDGYYNRFGDKNNNRLYDVGCPVLTYRNGPVDMGLLLNWVRRHRGPERRIRTAAVKANEDVRERDDFYGGAYIKYNNGRFFANSEFDWYDRLDRL